MNKHILVAGIGNSWLSDDGFGGEVVKRLQERELPEEAAVFDFGTGGLDLAYEVMRGYDALILIDVSRQGGEPGTLYVMEPSEADVEAGIEDGQVLDPHGMDPQTVLRFVKTLGAWPGKVVVVACEPVSVEEMHIGLSDQVAAAVGGAVDLVLEQVEELRHDAAYQAGLMHELSLSSAIVNTVVKHAAGRPVTVVNLRVGQLRQVVPDTLEFYFEFVARGTVCEGARLEQELVPALVRCEQCGNEWELDLPIFRCGECGGGAAVVSGEEFEVESIDVEEAECIAQR